MTLIKTLFIIFAHLFFIYSLLIKVVKKKKFNYQIYISSTLLLFSIMLITYVFNILNGIFFLFSVIMSVLFLINDFNKKNYKKNNFVFYLIFFLIVFSLSIFPPLTSWDGRSIWFFHSKIIFFEKSLWSPVWFSEEILFSQIHYPKLNAIISAYFSNLIGIWNYHYSKISLSLLLFPALIFFFTSEQLKNYKWIIMFIILLFFKNDLINGYMDSILSIYTLIGIFVFSQILENKKNLDENLIVLGLTIFIVTNLKDEGLVISSIIMFLFLLWIMKCYRLFLNNNFFYIFIFIVITGFIFNVSWKYFIYNLNNFAFFGEKNIQNIKINYENLLLIADFIIIKSHLIYYFITLILIIFLNILSKSKKILTEFSILLIIFSCLYLLIVSLVYLISPLEINWHLHSSANRVLDTIKFTITFYIIIFVLKKYEKKYF